MLIVVNERSPVSVRIGERYRGARGIPRENVARIQTDPREEVDRATFTTEIEWPIAAHLKSHRLQDRILVIVLTKGVPLKIRGSSGPDGTQASVDSELTLLYRALVQGPLRPAGRVANPYFRGEPLAPFLRAAYDIYLVTRLDGYSLEDVLGLTERASTPTRRGKVILETRRTFFWSRFWDRSATGDAWLREASERLKDSGLEVMFTAGHRIAHGEKDVIGYTGWGSNDPENRARTPGFQWLPGAIAFWFVSTSARTFDRPPPGWTIGSWNDPKSFYAGSPQSLIGDLIAEGVTGTFGFVYEPSVTRTVLPQILFPAYRAGFTLAESFYAAMPYLSWRAVVIGDPLVAPFGPVANRPAAASGVSLFLQRRAQVLETIVNRARTPGTVRALALTYAEQAMEKTRESNLREAIILATRAARLAPGEPAVLYTLGDVLEAQGQNAQAEETFRTLIRLDPTSLYAQQAAGRLRP